MAVYRCPSCSLKSLYETAGSLFGSFVDRFAELDCAAMVILVCCLYSDANERPAHASKSPGCDGGNNTYQPAGNSWSAGCRSAVELIQSIASLLTQIADATDD